MKCYLDNQPVHNVADTSADKISSLYACASKHERTNDVIVKVVNTNTKPVETVLGLDGAKLTGKVMSTVLTSESGLDENSLDKPTKVSPKAEAMKLTA